MKPREIETWALRIIDSVAAKKPIEDSRVELKREWPEAKKAARRIAGHANASRSEPILWLVGVDEDIGVTGCDPANFSTWYQQVCSEFDEMAPTVLDVALPFGDGIVCMALQFDTDRAPYVTKNPFAGQPNSGPVSLEVPWRSATSVHSATRRELLKILLPHEMLPEIDLLEASLSVINPTPLTNLLIYSWVFKASLYIVPPSHARIVIPFHRCVLEVDVGQIEPHPSFGNLSLKPLQRYAANGTTSYLSSTRIKTESASLTIHSTDTEVIIDGPGLIQAEARTEDATDIPIANGTLPQASSFKLSLVPVHSSKPAVISGVLNRVSLEDSSNEAARWVSDLSFWDG